MAAVYVGTLIVDDEDDIRTLIRLIIQAANEGLFVAGEAADGLEALSKVDEVDPIVIVIDQMMPGMCGIDTAKKMLEGRPDRIIILCTAFLDDELRVKAEQAGIKLCLRKEEFGLIPDALRAVQSALAS